MKVCFLLWNPDISGGTNVIFEHATRLLHIKNEVTVVTAEKVDPERLEWFPGAENLTWKTYEEIENEKFDLAIATWWRTVFLLHQVISEKYAYFVQSIESRFYPEEEVVLRNLVEQTYTLDVDFITEATWIKDYLYDQYGINAYIVKNGIRKEYFNNKIAPISPRLENKVRLLIEGPFGVSFKNTELALKIAKMSNADEIWLLTSSPIGLISGVDRLFSRIPVSQVGAIYSSCDILIKLSTVEGMFGPPLEAFHCGSTSISYDVTGYDEYIEHLSNALVSFTRDDSEILKYINQLCEDRELLNRLKKEAVLTAEKWPDWEESSKLFFEACRAIIEKRTENKYTSSFSAARLMWNTYEEFNSQSSSNFNSRHHKIKMRLSNKIKLYFPSLHSKIKALKFYIVSIINR